MADELLKSQNRDMALKNVQQGIKYYKEGRNIDALALFKKALSLDEQNVDALVARGALYANESELDRAIDDFRQALDIDPNHSNAKKYLFEVFVSHSVK